MTERADAIDVAASRDLAVGGAAKDGVDARDELVRVEGLRDVVVGAEAEAGDLSTSEVAGGEEDDGHAAGGGKGAADLEAVLAGHHDVEHEEVGLQLARLTQASLPS